MKHMGIKVAEGLQLMETFYSDMNDDSRAFAKRFAARPSMNGKMPSGDQAGRRGEEAERVEISLRLLQAGLDHSRRPGVPPMSEGGCELVK